MLDLLEASRDRDKALGRARHPGFRRLGSETAGQAREGEAGAVETAAAGRWHLHRGPIESLAGTSQEVGRRGQHSRHRPHLALGAVEVPECGTVLSTSAAGRLPSASSAKTGRAISAAPVGVGARRSAAWSMSVQSVSCPTAEISGMAPSATARTTASSLNPQRSSSEPPPRATMMRCGRRNRRVGIEHALKPRIAAATSAALVSPCTRTGQTTTCGENARHAMENVTDHRAGRRRHDPDRRSADTEAVCLRAASKSPSAASLRRRSSSSSHQGADTSRLQALDDDLVGGLARESRDLARGHDLEPLFGLDPHARERRLPDDGIDPRALVFQAEIGVAGRMRAPIVRDFAAQAHEPEPVLHRAFQCVRQLADRDFGHVAAPRAIRHDGGLIAETFAKQKRSRRAFVAGITGHGRRPDLGRFWCAPRCRFCQ